jgi:hypothetical protein
MGTRNGPYQQEFPAGTIVRVRDRSILEAFRAEWKWHHPLDPEQLDFAGQRARVKAVSFYHGGDELYELDNIPGIWHEQCLEAI